MTWKIKDPEQNIVQGLFIFFEMSSSFSHSISIQYTVNYLIRSRIKHKVGANDHQEHTVPWGVPWGFAILHWSQQPAFCIHENPNARVHEHILLHNCALQNSQAVLRMLSALKSGFSFWYPLYPGTSPVFRATFLSGVSIKNMEEYTPCLLGFIKKINVMGNCRIKIKIGRRFLYKKSMKNY